MEFAVDTEMSVSMPFANFHLDGLLYIPRVVAGVIVFAHGSGSDRHSPRNQAIATALQKSHFATLLFDLLTSEEERVDRVTSEYRFDIPLLAERLVAATDWLRGIPALSTLPVGYYGASTGGSAALVAAASMPDVVKAVVSRGGRADLAGDALENVRAPTLLIVGSLDDMVIELNQEAKTRLMCESSLEIISGAGHLFAEPGKMVLVSQLAEAWFKRFLIG